MALLSTLARTEVTGKFVRAFFVDLARTADLDVNEVETLVADLDEWLDSTQNQANNAITASVRSKANTSTKFAALAYVALKRAQLI